MTLIVSNDTFDMGVERIFPIILNENNYLFESFSNIESSYVNLVLPVFIEIYLKY